MRAAVATEAVRLASRDYTAIAASATSLLDVDTVVVDANCATAETTAAGTHTSAHVGTAESTKPVRHVTGYTAEVDRY